MTELYEKELLDIPDGVYYLTGKKKYWKFFEKRVSYGCLSIKSSDKYKDFMWTSNREYHDPLCGRKALNLTLDKHTGQLAFFMKSALSMWIKWSRYEDDDTYKEEMLGFVKFIKDHALKAEAQE